MPIQQRKYQSVEEIERDFERRIQNEDDPLGKADLRVELAQAKIDFRGEEARGRLVEAWRRLAMSEYPLAAKFPQLITGETEEEIMQSAKAAAEGLATLQNQTSTPDVLDQFQTQLYGRGSGSGGNGPTTGAIASSGPDRNEERWAWKWAENFNDAPRDAYGQRMGISGRDADRFANYRFVTQLKDQMRMWGNLTRSDFRSRG